MARMSELLLAAGLPTGDEVGIVRRRYQGGEGPRVALVAGLRGDTPEGVRVAHLVAKVLEGCHERLAGTVDIFPCVNPLAAHRGVRRWPFFDQDLNRRFPGNEAGHAPDRVARGLLDELSGVDRLVELRGAHPAFSEAPQAHVRAGDEQAAQLARHANVNVVWARQPGPAARSTLAGQVPSAISLEGGVGNRLTPGVGQALTEGVLNLLNVMGVLPDDCLPFHWAAVNRPIMVEDPQVRRVRADAGGLFLPQAGIWDAVEAGAPLGEVVAPTSGEVLDVIRAPARGRVLAVREQPVVLPGSMVVRLVEVGDA